MAQKVVDLFYSLPNRPKGKGVTVNISVACFVPKPFTPFEFEPQDTPEQFVAKQKLLLETVSSRKISISYHDSGTSRIEAILARGDRRLADVVEAVWQEGGRLEGWEDHFSPARWYAAMEQAGLSPDFYATRKREYDEPDAVGSPGLLCVQGVFDPGEPADPRKQNDPQLPGTLQRLRGQQRIE